MRIVELFVSKQGEGLWTGVESTFVRVGGCNLHCTFCDTTYASWAAEEGEELSVEEIVSRVGLCASRHVILTGGEPMLYSELIPLTQALAERNCRITIETAGTLELPVVCDLMSISPKLSNSTPFEIDEAARSRHETNRQRPEIVQRMIAQYQYQLKFVADEPEDLLEIERYLAGLKHYDPKRVYIMPMATDVFAMREKAGWIAPYCQKRGYQYCPRMQLEWYGNRRGT